MSGAVRVALGLLLGALLATLPFVHARYGLGSHADETAATVATEGAHAHHPH